jgi:opacity protein-like surface antigen
MPGSPGAASEGRSRGGKFLQAGRGQPGFPAWAILAGWFIAALLPSRGSTEESDDLRGYLNFRGADTNPGTDVHDAWGLGVGLNLNRYLGLELAGDNFEKSIKPRGYAQLGEYAVWSFVPQLRLRYPMLKGRLVPYVIGGVGGAFTQFNDRKPPGFGLSIKTDSSALMGAVGGGLEYFVADNISLGFEVKYLASSDQHLQVDGNSYDLSASAPLIMMSVRLHYPELHPPAWADIEQGASRFYLGIKAGGALPVHDQIFSGVHAKAEPPAYAGTLDQLFGLVAGANFGRHFSGEISVDGFETVLDVEGVGRIGEYAVVAIMPQVRVRYPLLEEERLMPYAIAGVGLGYNEFNDRKPAGAEVVVDAQTYGVTAALGLGIEYFVTSNIAFNFETRYLFSRGQTLQIDGGRERSGNLDALLFSLGLRVFFPGAGH